MNTSKPKYRVSIITCSLSDFDGLLRTLKSLEDLIGAQIESILILSQFSSIEISRLRNVSDVHHCKVIEQKPNGIYEAMNTGLSLAESEFCMFLNGGDEIFDPQAFKNFVFMLTNQEWAYAPIYIASSLKETQRKYDFKPYSRLKHRLSIKYVPHPGTIYRTEILKQMAGFNTTLKVAADQELAMRFAKKSQPEIGKVPFAIFYSGGTSTRNQDEITQDFKLISRQVYGYFFGIPLLDNFVWELVRYVRKSMEKFNSFK